MKETMTREQELINTLQNILVQVDVLKSCADCTAYSGRINNVAGAVYYHVNKEIEQLYLDIGQAVTPVAFDSKVK